jgi:coenzyme Q-binding protein COQ10
LRRHSVTKVLPYTPEQLMALVGDVRAYPEFVPWLTHMRVWNETALSPGVTSLDAEAAVGFAFLKEKFATRVLRDAGRAEIVVSLLYGPFNRLRNHWRFSPYPEGAQLQFDIDFEFKSRLLDGLLAANMDRAVTRLMECFEARAQKLYGPAPAETL